MLYIIVGVCFVFLFLFLLNKKSRAAFFEYAAWFWFKFAVVIVALFFVNFIFAAMEWGFYVPINAFSILTITILGLPGAICVSFLMLFKIFL